MGMKMYFKIQKIDQISPFFEEEEEYKKMFFKSAQNFRYGKVGKLNMLAFRKKFKQVSYGYENVF